MPKYHKYTDYDWAPPRAFLPVLQAFSDYALLYSARREAHTGRYSFLGFHPIAHVTPQSFADLPGCEEEGQNSEGLPEWIGHLGYGMRHAVEKGLTPAHDKSHVDLGRSRFTCYAQMLRFDHDAQSITHFCAEGHMPVMLDVQTAPALPLTMPDLAGELHSNFTKARYLQAVEDTKTQIAGGNFYQANITRKFYGQMQARIPAEALFERLCARSLAPYSALIKHENQAIISSSPECFLTLDTGRRLRSLPIKGSIRAEEDAHLDAKNQQILQQSAKDHAENLMIVDLMRHDFSRICTPGSVSVPALAKLHSYASIHHLVSEVQGQLRAGENVQTALKATFPPGSMTGAPKIAAMQWCQAQERMARGLYAGAIGWLAGQGQAEFSVVIRTILTDGARFEFQAGGGIVADSTPMNEWQESLVKAAPLADALGLSHALLEAL